MDVLRPQTIPDSSGIVRGQELFASNPFNKVVTGIRQTILSDFITPAPDQQYLASPEMINLLALPNGDVFYMIGAVSTKPLVPQPAWFNVSYYGYNGVGPERGESKRHGFRPTAETHFPGFRNWNPLRLAVANAPCRNALCRLGLISSRLLPPNTTWAKRPASSRG